MSNDLISREALKEELRKDLQSGGTKIFEFDKGYDLGLEMAIELIDNAPTVSDRYDEGYVQGYIDGSTGADMRKGGAE